MQRVFSRGLAIAACVLVCASFHGTALSGPGDTASTAKRSVPSGSGLDMRTYCDDFKKTQLQRKPASQKASDAENSVGPDPKIMASTCAVIEKLKADDKSRLLVYRRRVRR